MGQRCGQCPSLKKSFLCDVDEKVREEVRSRGISMHYKKGQDIQKQGRLADGCFCLNTGKVKTTLTPEYDEPLTTALFFNEGVIGIEALTGGTNVYSATCLSDSDLCFFPKSVAIAAANAHPGIAHRLNQIAHERFQHLTQVTLSLATKSVQERIAEALVKLQDIFGGDVNSAGGFEITREEIARLTATSIESVFRVLADFKAKCYLEIHGRRITLLNEKRLRSVGKMTPASRSAQP